MNLTTGTRRAAVRIVLGLLASFAVVLGIAVPSNAATGYYFDSSFSANSVYGWTSGNADISATGSWLAFGAYQRDTRNDGYCSVVQGRGVYSDGYVSGWTKISNNCSTTVNNYGNPTIYAASGRMFNRAQIRICQSDRYGNVIASCSSAVESTNVTGWHRVYFTY